MSQLSKTRAAEILDKLRDRYVLVLGDVMLDEFVWGDVTRISPEAPVPVVDVRRESVHLGGAANVLANLVALGARGSVVGVVGNDGPGQRLQTELRELGSRDGCLIVPKLRNFNSYRPATLVTPNHLEALRMSDTEDHSDDASHAAAKVIREKLGCDAVLITRGDRGMMLLEGDGQPVYVETAAREVYDVTGAGDTVIATLAGALATGATMLEAATLANHAAGIVVGKVGTATATADELLATFDSSDS